MLEEHKEIRTYKIQIMNVYHCRISGYTVNDELQRSIHIQLLTLMGEAPNHRSTYLITFDIDNSRLHINASHISLIQLDETETESILSIYIR